MKPIGIKRFSRELKFIIRVGIYNNIVEAKKNVSSKLNFVKPIKIEWSIE